MTASPEPAPLTITVRRRAWLVWPENYWLPLIGTRMPALLENGQVMAGVLVAAEEGDEEITLTFADLAPED